jgi:hypothetical protein
MRRAGGVTRRRPSLAPRVRVGRRVGVRRLLLGLSLTVSIAAASCSDTSGEAESPATSRARSSASTTSEPGASTTTTVPRSVTSPDSTTEGDTVKAEIIARYVGYWHARFAANSGTPNPDDPELREFATAEQLDAVINETRINLDGDLELRPAAQPAGIQRVVVTEISTDRAVVQECVVVDGVVVRRGTGEVVDDKVATHNVRGTLVRVDGAWKVSSAQLVQRWEGIAGCALAS